MWLSRVRVRRDAEFKTMSEVLMPQDKEQRMSVSHRMMWSLFDVAADAKRTFLWREETRGRFILLSKDLPKSNGILSVVETPLRFTPNLLPNEPLRFRLRANATVDRKRPGKKRSERCDVVMDAIHHMESGKRARPRNEVLGWWEDEQCEPLPLKAPRDWLDRQGENNGFTVTDAVAVSYDVLRVPHNNKGKKYRAMTFGVVDFEGQLTVQDPAQFIARVVSGFGRAKAFGCGLMLLRRA